MAFGVGTLAAWPREPAALRVDAPTERFSADRALGEVAAWAGGPRVTGTAAQRAAVNGLAARLRTLGFVAEPHEYGRLLNLEASATGDRGEGVWLVAHSDTVRGSPGGADDGLGLAVLVEAARVLSRDGVPARLHLLITDGEEAGLYGAQAFVNDAPNARRLVINVEARGSEGPAYMFQTAGSTPPLLSAWRASGCTAQAGSLARWVYESLPNDTDFTVLRASGAEGYDFALIHGAWRYHTPDDTLAGLDPRAVQQVGDCVVGLAQEWLRGRPAAAVSRLAWQQVGPWMVALPTWAVRGAALAGGLLVLAGMRGRGAVGGLLAWIAALALAAAVGTGALTTLVATWPDFLARPAEVEHPEGVYVGAWVIAAASAALSLRVAQRLSRRGAPELVGGWLGGSALCAATGALLAPEAGLVLLPGLFAAGARLHGGGIAAGAARVGAAGLAGAMLGPVLLALPIALTSRALPVLAVVPLLVVPWLLPLRLGASEKAP